MISIIVPNYNHARFLRRRIDSILAQTYQDFELILLDDCSTDESVSVLREYEQNPHVSHIVVNETNTGSPFSQWQRGFDLARGEYICIAESDDWWEPTILETLLNGMQDGVVLSVCQTRLVDENMRIGFMSYMTPQEGVVDGRDFVLHNLSGDTTMLNAGMAIFCKGVLAQMAPLYLDYKGAGDWMFWLQIALQGQVSISSIVLNNCYRHSGTVTSYSLRSGRDMCEGNSICQYAIRTLHPSLKQVLRILKQRYEIFIQQRNLYDTPAIARKAKRDLLLIHPLMPMVYVYKFMKSWLRSR